MTPENLHRIEIASRILAGLVSNNAVISGNGRCGWATVNCSESELASYALILADDLIKQVSP